MNKRVSPFVAVVSLLVVFYASMAAGWLWPCTSFRFTRPDGHEVMVVFEETRLFSVRHVDSCPLCQNPRP